MLVLHKKNEAAPGPPNYQFLSGVVDVFFEDVERELVAPDVDRVPVRLLVPSVELFFRLLLKSFFLPAQQNRGKPENVICLLVSLFAASPCVRERESENENEVNS